MENEKKEFNNLGGGPLTVEDVARIFANPFYCLTVSEDLTIEHEPMISEEMGIDVVVKTIAEDGDGGRKFARALIENLKGNFVK